MYRGVVMRHAKRISLCALMLMLLSVGVAHAQWVFLAGRRLQVFNSIASQLQNPSQGQVQGLESLPEATRLAGAIG